MLRSVRRGEGLDVGRTESEPQHHQRRAGNGVEDDKSVARGIERVKPPATGTR